MDSLTTDEVSLVFCLEIKVEFRILKIKNVNPDTRWYLCKNVEDLSHLCPNKRRVLSMSQQGRSKHLSDRKAIS